MIRIPASHFGNRGWVYKRVAFIATVEKYAPPPGRYCAHGVSRGDKAATMPEAFSVIDGKLYLNYNAALKTLWSKNVPGFIDTASLQWPTVAKMMKVSR